MLGFWAPFFLLYGRQDMIGWPGDMLGWRSL